VSGLTISSLRSRVILAVSSSGAGQNVRTRDPIAVVECHVYRLLAESSRAGMEYVQAARRREGASASCRHVIPTPLSHPDLASLTWGM